jgi:hypothetical protein
VFDCPQHETFRVVDTIFSVPAKMAATRTMGSGPRAKPALDSGATAMTKPIRVITEDRMRVAQFVFGEPMHVCLEGDTTIEPGEQSIALWQNVGGRLGVGQQISVENDARTMWRRCRMV